MEEYQSNEQLYRNLLTILKEFKNRPYHLAKYLIESDAFTDKFIQKLIESEKLNDISQSGEQSKALVKAIYFVDISHMTEYFNSFTDGSESKTKSIRSLTKELNSKLDQCLKEEKYEDAIRIRDYMVKHNIKRISQ
jgi:cysteinyl-tRNA synthetase